MTQDNEPILSAVQVAQRLRVHSSTVRAWARRGQLKGFQTRSGTWRFSEEQVRDFLRPNEPQTA